MDARNIRLRGRTVLPREDGSLLARANTFFQTLLHTSGDLVSR